MNDQAVHDDSERPAIRDYYSDWYLLDRDFPEGTVRDDVEPGAGSFARLLEPAEEKGSLTGEEIAEVLSTNEYPVEYETTTRWPVGFGESES